MNKLAILTAVTLSAITASSENAFAWMFEGQPVTCGQLTGATLWGPQGGWNLLMDGSTKCSWTSSADLPKSLFPRDQTYIPGEYACAITANLVQKTNTKLPGGGCQATLSYGTGGKNPPGATSCQLMFGPTPAPQVIPVGHCGPNPACASTLMPALTAAQQKKKTDVAARKAAAAADATATTAATAADSAAAAADRAAAAADAAYQAAQAKSPPPKNLAALQAAATAADTKKTNKDNAKTTADNAKTAADDKLNAARQVVTDDNTKITAATDAAKAAGCIK